MCCNGPTLCLSLPLWFFGVFSVTVVLFKLLSRSDLLQGAEWSRPLAAIFVALLVFARYYYPDLETHGAEEFL
jgi:hypothetical protein